MLSIVSGLNLAQFVIGYIACIAATYFAFRRQLLRKLVFLAIYIYIQIPRDLILDWFYYRPPKIQNFLYIDIYFYWITAIILSFLRILTIAEIGKKILSQSPAVWKLGWRVLTVVAFSILVWTAFGVVHERQVLQQYILTLEQRLNILASFLTLALMGIGIYYQLLVFPLYRRVLVGSCIYSAVQLVDTELGRLTMNPSNSVFDFAQRFTFTLMIGIWAWALWKWSGAKPKTHQLIPQAQYDELSPQVHDRLRKLNDRLAGLYKQR
jgi:hypothetical protein